MQPNRIWYKLDNAAKVFPGQNTSRWSNIFRCTVILNEKIQPSVLEQAVADVLPRFPCYDVRMRRGFFWYYLEKNDAQPPVNPDVSNICHRVKFNENNRFMFRVYYYEKKLSVEFYHALTDGKGATVFACTLAAQYLRLCGHDIPPGKSVLDINVKANKRELEDSFQKNAGSKGKVGRGGSKVYHAIGTKMPTHTVNITTGIMPLDKLHAKAKSMGVTVSEFTSALLLYVHYKKQKAEKRVQRDVSVQIPVSLRKAFGSETLRNYSLAYNFRIDPKLGEYSFEEIVRQLSLYLRYINNEKTLRAMTTANLKLEQSPLMKFLPLVIKNAAIGLSFLLTAEHSTSALLSNVGKIELPPEMESLIERIDFIAGPGIINGARCGAVGCKNFFSLTFVNIYEESDIEREFFTALVKMGIPVKIESNRERRGV